jgi:hypothetical protein
VGPAPPRSQAPRGRTPAARTASQIWSWETSAHHPM